MTTLKEVEKHIRVSYLYNLPLDMFRVWLTM